ncbi:hypothetical protein IFR05_012323 [Cadophora sp. M221]|nr:hypothetical protein IFR05_012323 [Cadophora sp. M221]
MFTRAFPLIGDYEPEPNRPASMIGHFPKCAVERGHVMLALHLIRLGAPLSGYRPFRRRIHFGLRADLAATIQSGFSYRRGSAQIEIPTCLIPVLYKLLLFVVTGVLFGRCSSFGADVDRASKDGPPPIIYAIKQEHVAIFQLLKDRSGDTTSPRVSRIAFDVVARNGLESMAELLLQEGALAPENAVTTALEHGHHGVVVILSGNVTDGTVDIAGFWDSE